MREKSLTSLFFNPCHYRAGWSCAKSFVWLAGVALFLAVAPSVLAQQAAPEAPSAISIPAKNRPSLPTISVSGEFYWNDRVVDHGWRIQQHAKMELYRLLDDKGFRRCFGTLVECETTLDQVRLQNKWQPNSGTAVITLHGFLRTRSCMESLGSTLSKYDDWTWVNVGYASTQGSVEDHAQSLAHVLENLEGFEHVHLVCHSLGNIVVRRYVAEAECETPRWKVDPRIGRMVMLGPPNQGAALANFWKGNKLATWLGGPVVTDLSPDSKLMATGLAVPKFEFGILAGSYSTPSKGNPLVGGHDDFIVGIEETKLEGAQDFCILPMHHGELIRDEKCHPYVISFLKEGSFASAIAQAKTSKDTVAPLSLNVPSKAPQRQANAKKGP